MIPTDQQERDENRRYAALNAAIDLFKHQPVAVDATKILDVAKAIEAFLKGEENGQV